MVFFVYKVSNLKYDLFPQRKLVVLHKVISFKEFLFSFYFKNLHKHILTNFIYEKKEHLVFLFVSSIFPK